MKIFIITSCTGEKAIKDKRALTIADFQSSRDVITDREKELADLLTPADSLYTGEQHLRLMKGIKEVNNVGNISLDFHILSAGYGLIKADRKIIPYEVTFSTMKKMELVNWSNYLNIPAQFRTTVATPYDFGMVLLGEKYLEACQLDSSVQFGGPTLLFCSPTVAKQLPHLKNVKVVTLYNPEAKRMSCGLTGLKGELGARILRKISKGGQTFINKLMNEPAALDLLDEPREAAPPKKEKKALKEVKTLAKKKVAVINPTVNQIIAIPEDWKTSAHKNRIRYFIPEWDDLVDPEFDFINDTHSGGTGNWHNQVYAHQMYPSPNYDGILISRVVVDGNKKRRELMESLGVHGSLRVPQDYPVMGDCGAFGYLTQEKPPYSTTDVLDYYTRYGFNLGVSVDHLIIGVTDEVALERYQLTIQNAEDFLKEHKKSGLSWRPIGAVQGWDPKSYAEAAKQYVKMGYDYIALGGLVRTKTEEILRIVEEVSKVVPRSVDVHLFGLARLEAMRKFSNMGITSVDSASHLRRAWLGASDNYWTLEGARYAALRIPQPGKKLLVEKPDIKKLEQKCLETVRRYDKGKASLEETLNILDDYDAIVMENRKSMRTHYERTLLNEPWKKCPCSICQKEGIEVIIFRGNNRNRRRGFHNTFVFYSLLKRILTDEFFYFDRSHKLFETNQAHSQDELLLFKD